MSRKSSTLLRVVTNSERENFGCRRLWWFGSVEGLARGHAAAPLRQGSLFGRGLEMWLLAQMQGSRRYEEHDPVTADEVEREIVSPWLEQRRTHNAELDEDAQEERDAEDDKIAAQTVGMLRGYFRRWENDLDEWEVIAVEAQVARWLVHPVTGRPIADFTIETRDVAGHEVKRKRKRRWSYGGKIDALKRHRSSGAVWVFETKTTQETNLDKFARKLHFDPQTRGYAWALADPIPHLSREVLGWPRVEGVVYDIVRKAAPEVPTLVKKGDRLVKASTLTTNRETYLAAILANGFDPDSEEYAPQLAALAKQRWFHREPYSFTDVEIDDYGRDVAWTALEMIDEERKPYHTRQVRLCTGVNRGCPGGFESICMADGPMARKSFGLLTIRHPELTGDLAEPIAVEERATIKPAKREKDAEPLEDCACGTPLCTKHTADGRDRVPDLFAEQPAAVDEDEVAADPFAAEVDEAETESTMALEAALAAQEPTTTDDDYDDIETLFGPSTDE